MVEVFPLNEFSAVDITLQHTIYSSRTRGGFISNVRVADPYWSGELVTVGLEKAELEAWEAFLQDCIDRNLSIDFVHPLYRCPISYNPDTVPGSPTGTVGTFPDSRTIAVSGLASGLILKKGDRISLEQGDRVMYFMVGADVTIGASTTNVNIVPRLRTGLFTSGAVVRVVNAKMRVKITPNTISVPLAAGEATYLKFGIYENGK